MILIRYRTILTLRYQLSALTPGFISRYLFLRSLTAWSCSILIQIPKDQRCLDPLWMLLSFIPMLPLIPSLSSEKQKPFCPMAAAFWKTPIILLMILLNFQWPILVALHNDKV